MSRLHTRPYGEHEEPREGDKIVERQYNSDPRWVEEVYDDHVMARGVYTRRRSRIKRPLKRYEVIVRGPEPPDLETL